MNTFQIIAVVFAAVVNCLHFYFSFVSNLLMRRVTKPFCMSSLILILISFGCTDYLLYSAVSLALLGDVFLMFKNRKFFYAGTLSFFLSHLMYILKVFTILGIHGNGPFYVVWLILFVSLTFTFGFMLRKKFKVLSYLGSAYFMVLFCEFLILIYLFVKELNLFILLSSFGVLLHILSDAILCLARFSQTKIKRKDFFVMIPYVLGQFLICLGLFLC